jgi:hypothetical protein
MAELQRIEGDHVAPLLSQMSHGVRTDVAGAAGHENSHGLQPAPSPAPRWHHGPITDDHDSGGSAEPQDQGPDDEQPSGFDRWRKESAIGEVGTSIAKGLRNVFAPTQQEVVIVASVPGDPPDADQKLRVVLDPDDPSKSVAIFPEVEHTPDAHPAAGPDHPPDDVEPGTAPDQD